MNKLEELQNKGCCVLEQVLPEKLTQQCIDISNKALESLSIEHREKNKSQGSMVHLADYPEYTNLIASPELMKALEDNFNFSDLRFSSGYLISKPPKSPPLFWHQDWWGWEHKSSYTDFIHQIYIMENPTYVHSSGFSTQFFPNTYVKLSMEELKSKLEAFSSIFESQSRPSGNCLSNDGIKAWARYRGIEARCEYAEALKCFHRQI